MDILLFGGSFDPPHEAHVRMLQAALRRLKPARAYAVPAFRSPLKSGTRASAAHRLRMARSAFGDLAQVSRFELDRRGKSYTYRTLRHFARRHPGARLHFLVGSDSLAGFHDWGRPAELRRLCRFLVGRRPGAGKPAPRLPRLSRLPGLFPDVSSTEVRARLLAGEDVSRTVPKRVLSYIRKRRLYGADIRARLARSLKPSRLRHSVCVARAALALALRHGLDPEKAALAGLVHDCSRALKRERMPAYAHRHKLRIPGLREMAVRNPLLIHGWLSEHMARSRYGVSDPEVLAAVRRHALGDAGMSALDRLLYVADVCSEDRAFPEAKRIRAAALRDLDEGFREAVRLKITEVRRRGGWLHPVGSFLWDRVVRKR